MTTEWIKVRNGWVSAAHITALTPIQVAGGWQVRVTTVDGGTHHLPEQHPTREDAHHSAFQMVTTLAGIDEPGPMTTLAERRDLAKVHAMHTAGATPKEIIGATGLSPAKVAEYLATPADEVTA